MKMPWMTLAVLFGCLGLTGAGCKGTVKPHLRSDGPPIPRAYFATPTSKTFPLASQKLQRASEKALAEMGFFIDRRGQGWLVTSEKPLDIHGLSQTRGLRGPQVFCSLTVLLEETESGAAQVTPKPKLVVAPNYNPDSRVPVELPGWEMELRKEFFERLTGAI